MRKGYVPKTHFKGNVKRSKYTEEENKRWRGFNTHDGAMVFAYKGLVIEKRNSLYKVRDVKLEGFPVASVAGIFNNSQTLRSVIEAGLCQSSVSKLARLRERNRNVKCNDCGTPFLFRREQLEDYLEGKILQCPYCYHEEWDDRLEWAPDDNFY
ncbi:hypothetical protein FVB43_06410 [Erwinia rhapontici]|uniref:hypothetical protein n=1 Tax=Erwinia rhapontici TaxID=55212 RepID=UPI0014385C65|nr:hypothetical protein [Erwinia rhapontici]NKG29672.1 hypothetical protein [Erwinia rhapontici]